MNVSFVVDSELALLTTSFCASDPERPCGAPNVEEKSLTAYEEPGQPRGVGKGSRFQRALANAPQPEDAPHLNRA
jgi:hypothetical protein